MIRIRTLCVLSVLAVTACGPNEPPHAVTGAILGGMGGAAIGAAAGGGRTNNILIGAAAGAVAGAAVGAATQSGGPSDSYADQASPHLPHFSCIRQSGEVNYQPLQYTCTDDNGVASPY